MVDDRRSDDGCRLDTAICVRAEHYSIKYEQFDFYFILFLQQKCSIQREFRCQNCAFAATAQFYLSSSLSLDRYAAHDCGL